MIKKNILGVILARAGSKGIKKKNIKILSGHPLISYSIYAGKKSKLITLLFYFADDDWKEEWGGSTIFYRFKSKEAEQVWRMEDWSWVNAVPEENYQQFYDLFEVYAKGEYKPNALGGFCASYLSYHAVNPIQIDESRQRRTVLLTFDITPSYTTFNIFAQRLGHYFRGMKAKPKS